MGLVDYSSEEEDAEAKAATPAAAAPAPTPTALPPLPPAFHDLYAATVRTAPADDPSLHHGRRRAIPHVAGQWPSHLYIEWFPSPADHARLDALLAALRRAWGVVEEAEAAPSSSPAPLLLHSLVTSDLGAPLPLHISLSRPFVLSTAAKAGFLARLVDAVAAARVAAFDVAFSGLDWYRSPDAPRAFLVLRVRVQAPPPPPPSSSAGQDVVATTPNQPLVALLACCNEQVAAVRQPTLYAGAGDTTSTPAAAAAAAAAAASAFHVSVAWTLAPDDVIASWAASTQAVYEQWQQREDRGQAALPPPPPPLRFRVDSVKAKIGNVVTAIPLAAATRARAKRRRSGSPSADERDRS